MEIWFNETIHHNVDRANAMIGTLEGVGFGSVRDTLSTSLSECRAVCANRVPDESIIQDFTENWEFYDSWLTSRLGKSGSTGPEKPTSQQGAPNTAASLDLAHVEFGRTLPGVALEAKSGGLTGTDSPETQTQYSEGLTSVSIGLNVEQRPVEFALPLAQRAPRSKDLKWLTRGESIQIQGRTLPYGFVYVGKGVNSEQHYAINPWLTAKAESSTPLDVAGYYFSYGEPIP